MDLTILLNALPEVPFDHFVWVYKIRYYGSKFPFKSSGEIKKEDLFMSNSIPFYMKYSKNAFQRHPIMLASITCSFTRDDEHLYEYKLPKVHSDLLLKFACGVLICSAQNAKDSVLPINILFSRW